MSSKPAAAYAIGNIVIKDPVKWAKYCSMVPATIAPWGAELVFRGKRMTVMSGEQNATDTVVIRFPDADAVSNWFNSSAYQALIPLRDEAADVVLVSYSTETS